MKTGTNAQRRTLIMLSIIALIISIGSVEARDNSPEWFYPEWAAAAKYNQPIRVLDTDSALGRYSLNTTEIGLKDLARMHGHLCDGLVIAYIQIKAVLNKLFPDGIVDRTDLQGVSKNGPCWVDALAFMTGARINFQTLRIENGIGDGYIIQKISTGEAYDVHLKPGIFPAEQAKLENKIRSLRAAGQTVTPEDIDNLDRMADALSRKLLNTAPAEILDIKPLAHYKFVPIDLFGGRGDVINKAVPR